MGRYRSDQDYDREYSPRDERDRSETSWAYDERNRDRRPYEEERRPDYRRSRFGERADYVPGEPRYGTYGNYDARYRDDRQRSSLDEVRGDLGERTSRRYADASRSRLRSRDIMTRDLVVATRDTTIQEVAIMMKQEDTGVIPVVDYDLAGNGKTATTERGYDNRHYSRGKLVGLITDRDIVCRAVADNKDCATTRAEEIMSTDIKSARPNDRVADVIRKMGEKQVRRIPVVNENGYLVGMISMADVSRETEDDRELGETLEEISKGPSFWSRMFS